MAEGYSINITGLAELERKLKALDRRVQTKIVKKAIKTGSNIILQQAKSNAVSIVGNRKDNMGSLLEKNLQVKAFKKQKRGSYGISVRLKSGVMEFIWITQDGTREYIPAAIEFGHYGGWQQESPTFVAAIPFIRPAFDSKAAAATRVIGNVLKVGVEINR